MNQFMHNRNIGPKREISKVQGSILRGNLVRIPGGKARPEKQYFKYTKSLYLIQVQKQSIRSACCIGIHKSETGHEEEFA